MMLTIQNMSGAGNLFNVIDNRLYCLTKNEMRRIVPQIVLKTTTKHFRTEGIMFIDESDKFDFIVSFFNNDGSSGMMCGNGGRCAVKFAKNNNFFTGDSAVFIMADCLYSAIIADAKITLEMPAPIVFDPHYKYYLEDKLIKSGYYDVGSDHFVVQDVDLDIDFFDDLSFIEKAKLIRNDLERFPKGVNINLYSIRENEILIKTYERGIERITGACGTGAISTAIHCKLIHELSTPVKLIPPSSSVLHVDFSVINEHVGNVSLSGSAELLDIVNIDIERN